MNGPRHSLEKVEAALEQSGGQIAGAAREVGCARKTIYEYMARYERVRAAWERGRAAWGIEAEGGSMPANGKARPKYSPRRVAAALEAAHGSVRAAAQALGCSQWTVRCQMERYAVVREAYRRAYEAAASASEARPGAAPGGPARYQLRAEEVAEAVRQAGGRLATAAELLKCSQPAVRRYIERFPEVREAFEEERAVVIDTVESKLIEAVERGDLRAVKFVLSTLGKDRGYTKRWGPGDWMEDDDMAEMRALVEEVLGAEDGEWEEEGDEEGEEEAGAG
jgi:predicted transcriptional regulator